jgi:hypothetical protein
MKNRLELIFVAIICIGMAGCTEPCDIPCLNGGTCEDGACVCPTDFGGMNCQNYIGGGGDACADVDCGDNGNCVEGDCVCDEGYAGVNCELEIQAIYIGTYDVVESCSGGSENYTSTFTESTAGIGNVWIHNLGNHGASVNATINGYTNTLTIYYQVGGGLTFNGTGQLNGDTLTITYDAWNDQSFYSCTATMTKQ